MGGAGGALRIYEVRTTPSLVTIEVIWIHPPGAADPIGDFDATIIGGTNPNADSGKLFPGKFELSQGAHSVTVLRSKGSDLAITINAGGLTANFHLDDPNAMAIQSASPVGTIIASMLPPNKYSQATGDNSRFDEETAFWVPADGRLVTGSKYAEFISSRVPDLRGVFLRGVNTFEYPNTRSDGFKDPDERQPGSVQGDEVGGHDHTELRAKPSYMTMADGGDGVKELLQGRGSIAHDRIPTEGNPEGETRPNNVAVYYYIRIN